MIALTQLRKVDAAGQIRSVEEKLVAAGRLHLVGKHGYLCTGKIVDGQLRDTCLGQYIFYASAGIEGVGVSATKVEAVRCFFSPCCGTCQQHTFVIIAEPGGEIGIDTVSGTAKIRASIAHVEETGALEVGFAEVALRRVTIADVGVLEIGPAEVGARERRRIDRQSRSLQIVCVAAGPKIDRE